MAGNPYVFISYSSKETSAAEQVCNVLLQNGIACWMAPASIEGGSDYTKAIPSAITNCSAVVLVCSKNAQNSYWVKSEVIDAISKGKQVIPFIIDRAEMNSEFNFMLSPAQRINAYENKAKAYEKLVVSVNSILDSAPAANPASVPPKPVGEPIRVSAQKPVDNTVRVTAQKPTGYSFTTIMIWILYAVALFLFIAFWDNYSEIKADQITATSFFLITILMPIVLICSLIIRKHKTAPINVIKKRRLALMMIFVAYWAVVEILNLLINTGVLTGFLQSDSGFGLISAVIIIGVFAAFAIMITFTISFRRTKYTIA